MIYVEKVSSGQSKKMKKIIYWVGAAVLVTVSAAYAEDSSVNNGFGVDFSFDANKKHYKQVDLVTQTFTVSPSYRRGDVSISLDMPYIHETIDGAVTFKKQRKIRKKRYVIGTYSVHETASGMGDMSLSLNDRFWRSEDKSDELNVTYIHKFDNGSDDYTVGSGSVDDTVELGYSHYWQALSATLAAGHTNVNGGGSNDLQADSSYSYAYLDLSYMLNDYFALGVMYDYAQSQYENKPDHDEITYSISLMPTDSTLIKAYYLTDGEKGQPEWESGISATYSY
ncbi:MAG TPA: hypothetical protein VFM46_04825 [Pseudomonadales bacterium]|nr:hypothetical protein [Pseudomonadales bacterium]